VNVAYVEEAGGGFNLNRPEFVLLMMDRIQSQRVPHLIIAYDDRQLGLGRVEAHARGRREALDEGHQAALERAPKAGRQVRRFSKAAPKRNPSSSNLLAPDTALPACSATRPTAVRIARGVGNGGSGASTASAARTATRSTVTSMRLEAMRSEESRCSPAAPSR
jgi:hypothetical protein